MVVEASALAHLLPVQHVEVHALGKELLVLLAEGFSLVIRLDHPPKVEFADAATKRKRKREMRQQQTEAQVRRQGILLTLGLTCQPAG